ncbi:esterase OVCA2 isoform X1 [Neodiprion virginianus]|uniref:esterase OVCA2 isoform X1 n=1 Tax=Neodiprion fabricii TaxID=2872261 RepID=UPI001ED94092|nr:esterase OVCA2 isoform X1 [Neodiprion fabricii]XP_046434989.1 esterase OVCA2 isoform X1 [Neodiprion fabricii]XP_046629633.1 esterase OVCA2 isoform X1 [Neodiprion virginianus]XP_046629634.1 esterase OVCA2 isoform X1 [Neodiprion virginianus]
MTEVKKQLQVLALHGYYQSDVVFRGKIGSLRKAFKKEINFTFLRAPHKVPRDPSGKEAEEGAEAYGWWFNNKNSEFKATVGSPECVGLEESLRLVEKCFEEKGPFDGILGFSQGAAFSAILCAMQQQKLSPIRFNFAILISGFKSLCEPHSVFYNQQFSLPSLHIYGTTDQIIPTEMAEDLASLFTDATRLTHDGGHFIPSRKHLYNDFIQKMLTIKDDSANGSV